MNLKSYLRENEIRPTAFAEQIGVSPSTITRILNGERFPGLDIVMRIRDATGGQVTPEDFLAGRQESAA